MSGPGAFVYLDKLQPQMAGFMSLASRSGQLSLPGAALLLIEVAPTALIVAVADIAAKSGQVRASLFQLDGRVGYLALSSESVEALRDVAIQLEVSLGLDTSPTRGAKIVAERLVSRLDAQHAYLTNRLRSGSLCVAGEAMLVLECQPSPMALLAMNQAEKAAPVKLIDARFTGSMGRLIVSGTQDAVHAAHDAALLALAA